MKAFGNAWILLKTSKFWMNWNPRARPHGVSGRITCLGPENTHDGFKISEGGFGACQDTLSRGTFGRHRDRLRRNPFINETNVEETFVSLDSFQRPWCSRQGSLQG